MQMFIQALFVFSLIAGIFCQKIVFDNIALISPCNTGARCGVDSYVIHGTIGENVTELLKQRWQPVIFIRLLRTSSLPFKTICRFAINGATCVPSPAPNCECFYNTTTEQVYFTANNTVKVDDNNAVIYALWQNASGTNIYSNKNYTLRDIYDVSAAHLTLTVAGVTGNLPSGVCSFNLKLNRSNDLELCCSNTAKPCYPQISFNGAVVTKNTAMCVTYQASQLASDGVTGNLDLSYSVCSQTGFIPGSNCSVIPKPEPPAPSDHNKCKTICPAVIVPVVVVPVVAEIISAGLALHIIKMRSKAISNHGGKDNADAAHASEQHLKNDRHNAEHRNQAYDGRRSSPSEVTIDDVKTTEYENTQQRNKAHEKDSNKPISDRTDDDNASQSVPGNPRQLPPLKGTHTHGQLHPPAVSRQASVEITSATEVKP